jgi:hypothetical protein
MHPLRGVAIQDGRGCTGIAHHYPVPRRFCGSEVPIHPPQRGRSCHERGLQKGLFQARRTTRGDGTRRVVVTSWWPSQLNVRTIKTRPSFQEWRNSFCDSSEETLKTVRSPAITTSTTNSFGLPYDSISIEDEVDVGQLHKSEPISTAGLVVMNHHSPHQTVTARSCSTENANLHSLPRQLLFIIFVHGSISPTGCHARISTYAYPAGSEKCVTIRKSSQILLGKRRSPFISQATT